MCDISSPLLHVNAHRVVVAKSLAAVGTLSRAICATGADLAVHDHVDLMGVGDGWAVVSSWSVVFVIVSSPWLGAVWSAPLLPADCSLGSSGFSLDFLRLGPIFTFLPLQSEPSTIFVVQNMTFYLQTSQRRTWTVVEAGRRVMQLHVIPPLDWLELKSLDHGG